MSTHDVTPCLVAVTPSSRPVRAWNNRTLPRSAYPSRVRNQDHALCLRGRATVKAAALMAAIKVIVRHKFVQVTLDFVDRGVEPTTVCHSMPRTKLLELIALLIPIPHRHGGPLECSPLGAPVPAIQRHGVSDGPQVRCALPSVGQRGKMARPMCWLPSAKR